MSYNLVDVEPPTLVKIDPIPGVTVPALTRIKITFSEPVGDVQGSDLLVNGVPAQKVTGSLEGPYVFEFPQPVPGPVQIAWATNHAIHDFAQARNEFVPTPWAYTIMTAPYELGVLINEIMYHPASEAVSEEYVELYNTNNVAVSLAGWTITGGIDFTFPDVTIPAGDYLVVAANVAGFSARYSGITNVVGGWTGRLSNGDDNLRLRNALGDVVNSVSYADEGDWAVRVRSTMYPPGWEWASEADGGGKSLELMNANLPNDNGQNWSPSLVDNGTPGRANSTASGNIAPLIYNVAHYPLLPYATNAVTVTARIIDETPSGPTTVVLRYRNASSSSAPPYTFSTVDMFDDGLHNDGIAGDHVYGAELSAMSSGHDHGILRFGNRWLRQHAQLAGGGAGIEWHACPVRQRAVSGG